VVGAGSSTVAFALEQDYRGDLVDSDSDSTPEYYLPGRDIQVTDGPALENNLEDIDQPDNVESVESVAGHVQGSFSVEWAMSLERKVEELIFNSGGTSFTSGVITPSTWFFGLDYLSGTAERAVHGVWPEEYSLSYDDETNTVRESLSCGYATESFNTSIAPSNIQGPASGESVPFHGTDLTLNAVAQSKLSTAELTIGNIAQPVWDAERPPVNAIQAKPDVELSLEAVFSEADQYKLALGGADATAPQDQLTALEAVLTFAVGGSTVTEFTLSSSKVGQYDWNNLVSEEATTESITLDVNGTEVTA